MRQILLSLASHLSVCYLSCYTSACTAPSLLPFFKPDSCAKRTHSLCSFFPSLFQSSFTHTLSIQIIRSILYTLFVRYQAIIAPHTHFKSHKARFFDFELISFTAYHHHHFSLCRTKTNQNNISSIQHYPSDNQPRQASPAKKPASQPRQSIALTKPRVKHLTCAGQPRIIIITITIKPDIVASHNHPQLRKPTVHPSVRAQ